MSVFRVEKNKGYTVMSNHHLRNKNLSLKAKGLLSQMLSLPVDWDYTLAGLAKINKEKIDAIRAAIRELEEAGYITRVRERDEKGRLRGTDYVIYEYPQTADGSISEEPILENPMLDNPTLEKPTLEEPTLDNPTQLNKDKQIKEELIKESNPIFSGKMDRREGGVEYKEYEHRIKKNISYDILLQDKRIDQSLVDEIVELILEILCSRRKTIRIAGDDYPADLVKERLLKLNSEHMRYVLDCMAENTSQVRNIKQYLKAVIFNAPSTIDNYYRSKVSYDLKSGNLT